MTPTKYAVVNLSSLITDADCLLMHLACQWQLKEHVAPSWERAATGSVFVPRGAAVPDDCYPIYVIDDPDQADVLGYHSEDPGGKAYGRVFAHPALASGGTALTGASAVSVTLSHEVIEFFVDRSCQLWADRGDGTMVAYEACDPVEELSYVVNVGSVPVSVSDFVFGAWFDPLALADGRGFNMLGTVLAPLQLSPGGYAVLLDTATGKTSETYGSAAGKARHQALKPAHKAARSSRRAR